MPIDPTVLGDLVNIYQAEIDGLINSLGKNVTLYFKPTISAVNDQFFDVVRPGDELKPEYKGTASSPEPIKTDNIKVIKALLKWSTRNNENYSVNQEIPRGTLRLKTFLSDVPDLQRCEYIIPNSDSTGIILAKYKLSKQPQPVGLQKDRYAITYWELII